MYILSFHSLDCDWTASFSGHVLWHSSCSSVDPIRDTLSTTGVEREKKGCRKTVALSVAELLSGSKYRISELFFIITALFL